MICDVCNVVSCVGSPDQILMQQATINLPPGNPVRALQGLARQIALPGEHAPERFPSFPALERTATIGFMQPATVTVPAGGSCRGFLCRQAAFPFWYEQNAVSAATWGCTWFADFANTANNVAAGMVSLRNTAMYSQYVGNNTATSTSFGIASAASQFTWSIAGVDNTTGQAPFVYIPANFRMVVMAGLSSTFGAAATFTVTLERWAFPGEAGISNNVSFTVALGNRGGGVDVGTVTQGWYRPTSVSWTQAAVSGFPSGIEIGIFASAATAVTVASSAVNYPTMTLTAGATPYGLLPGIVPSEFSNSTLPWLDTRVTAVGLLLSNVTQVLNKGGTFLAGRLSPENTNPWVVTATTIQGLHPAEKAWLPMETGMYTYCPPSTDMANFWDYSYVLPLAFPSGVTPLYCPLYRLDNTSLVNHFIGSGSANAENFAASVAWHMEFRTSSALFQIALSGMSLETLHSAQIALAAAGFFFENPEHDSVLNKIIAGVRKVAPQLITAVGKAHPMAGHVIKMTNAAITGGKKKVNIPQAKTKMQPTSADKSGITTAAPQKKKKGGNKNQKPK